MAAKKSEPKPIEGSISRAGFADKVDASRVHRTFKIMPSAIIEPDEPFTPLWTPEPDAPRERRRA